MRGRLIPLSVTRRFIADLCWLARRTPIGVIRGTIDVAPLLAARRAAAKPAPPFTAMFAKAFAIAAREMPPLRQSYVSFPVAKLYEVPVSVVSIMIEREHRGERILIPALIKDPAGKSLAEITERLESARTAPFDSIPHFERLRRITRLPLLLRRALWLFAFNSGRQRPNYFGTFGISVLGQLDVDINYPMSPLTTFLSYGPFRTDGTTEMTIAFDHRTYDGALAAAAIRKVSEILNTEIARELLGGVPAESDIEAG